MHTANDKYLISGPLAKSGFLSEIDDADDFFDKIAELSVKGQTKLMHDRWAKGLPWCYTNEAGENVIDYGVKKEYF